MTNKEIIEKVKEVMGLTEHEKRLIDYALTLKSSSNKYSEEDVEKLLKIRTATIREKELEFLENLNNDVSRQRRLDFKEINSLKKEFMNIEDIIEQRIKSLSEKGSALGK